MHVCVYSCVSQHLAERNFGRLRLVMEKTTKKKKPKVDYETRSAHGRAVN